MYKKDGRIDLRFLPKIVIRPLHQHQADGQAHQVLHSEASGEQLRYQEPTIEIHANLRGQQKLETVIHEALHLACPWMFERVVFQTARYISKVVWHMMKEGEL